MNVQIWAVAGTFAVDDVDWILEHLKVGIDCRLVREPENKYDKNAIAVYAPQKIGYIPRKMVKELAPQIDRGIGMADLEEFCFAVLRSE